MPESEASVRKATILALITLSIIVSALLSSFATVEFVRPKATTVFLTSTITTNSSLPFSPPVYMSAAGQCYSTTYGYTLCGVYDFAGALRFNCWNNLSQSVGCTYHFGTPPENGTIMIRFLGSNYAPGTNGFNCEYDYLGPSPNTYFQGLCYPTNSTAFVVMEPGSPGGDLNVH